MPVTCNNLTGKSILAVYFRVVEAFLVAFCFITYERMNGVPEL